MAKPLRSQLNQIRAWVRQGRTDAWIAHQLEVSAAELREFRRRHGLSPEEEGGEELDLRDEIEAEIEATMSEEAAAEEAEAEAEEEAEGEAEVEAEAEAEEGARAAQQTTERDGEGGDGEAGERRRRRRRRGGRRRRRGRGATSLEATFDHGEADGYGLWLDPAIQDNPVYAEHWAGHRKVEVTLEPDRIVIKRSE